MKTTLLLPALTTLLLGARRAVAAAPTANQRKAPATPTPLTDMAAADRAPSDSPHLET